MNSLEGIVEHAEQKEGALVQGFCEQYGKMARGILIPYAVEVAVIARMGGVRQAAQYMAEFFGRSISQRTVEELLRKIREGKIKVTEEDIRHAALTHPLAARYFQLYPSLANPRAEIEEFSQAPSQGKKQTKENKPAAQYVGTSTLSPERIAAQKKAVDELSAAVEADKN